MDRLHRLTLLLVIALLAGACTRLSEEVACALPPEPSIEVPRPVDLDGDDGMGAHAVALADAYGIDRSRIRWAVDLSWTRLTRPRVVTSGDVVLVHDSLGGGAWLDRETGQVRQAAAHLSLEGVDPDTYQSLWRHDLPGDRQILQVLDRHGGLVGCLSGVDDGRALTRVRLEHADRFVQASRRWLGDEQRRGPWFVNGHKLAVVPTDQHRRPQLRLTLPNGTLVDTVQTRPPTGPVVDAGAGPRLYATEVVVGIGPDGLEEVVRDGDGLLFGGPIEPSWMPAEEAGVDGDDAPSDHPAGDGQWFVTDGTGLLMLVEGPVEVIDTDRSR